ncbi:MAG: nucleotidyltransferase family protein [Clostridia bacterium]|nr:nucleotidyltransferase family protein [Clostridia bacterium]
MKICAIICEYNPFHLGHRYLIEQIKKTNQFDTILCVMSEHFTQRGEIAMLDSYTRARHAVLGGADAVVSLPCVFATSSAETFAKGAINLLSTIPSVKAIAFGVENGSENDFRFAAEKLNNETKEIRESICESMKTGMSYIRAREKAYGEPSSFLSSPNNILGIEYARAILSAQADISIIPVKRVGQGYLETNRAEEFASASSIRAHLNDGGYLKNHLPAFVFDDILPSPQHDYEIACMTALRLTDKETLKSCPDCSEGLENAILSHYVSYGELVDSVSGKRYTKSRIRRILLHNLLGIRSLDMKTALRTPLYLKVLAVGENKKILSALSESPLPLLTKGEHALALNREQAYFYALEQKAERIYEVCAQRKICKKIF